LVHSVVFSPRLDFSYFATTLFLHVRRLATGNDQGQDVLMCRDIWVSMSSRLICSALLWPLLCKTRFFAYSALPTTKPLGVCGGVRFFDGAGRYGQSHQDLLLHYTSQKLLLFCPLPVLLLFLCFSFLFNKQKWRIDSSLRCFPEPETGVDVGMS
jgi:hypothetical protein